jgi:hypothetical protein
MQKGGSFPGFMIVLLLALGSSGALGQVPNAGFENWVTDADTNLNPVGWETTNSHPTVVNVERVSPGVQGLYAMKVKTVNVGIVFPGVAMLKIPFSFSVRPTQFSAWIRSTRVGGDIAYIILGLMKGDSIVASVDSCTFKVDTSYSQFTQRQFRIAYQSNLTPDSLVLIVASGLGTGHVGTEIIIDEIAFNSGGATDVKLSDMLPHGFGLSQNFPNPFNPSTIIRYQVAAPGHVTLKIFDLLGREVTTLVDETRSPGEHTVSWNAGDAASGVYIYRLQSGTSVESKKLVVLR